MKLSAWPATAMVAVDIGIGGVLFSPDDTMERMRW